MNFMGGGMVITPGSKERAQGGLKVSEHDSLWQPPAAHSEERPRPQKSSRAQCCLNALAPGYLKYNIIIHLFYYVLKIFLFCFFLVSLHDD